MRHSRPDTTQSYTDEVELEELAEALQLAALSGRAQASPDEATLEHEPSRGLETEEVEAAGIEPASASTARASLVAVPLRLN
jgi:hypothetical protein